MGLKTERLLIALPLYEYNKYIKMTKKTFLTIITGVVIIIMASFILLAKPVIKPVMETKFPNQIMGSDE